MVCIGYFRWYICWGVGFIFDVLKVFRIYSQDNGQYFFYGWGGYGSYGGWCLEKWIMGQCLGFFYERRQKLRILSCFWSQGDVIDFIFFGDIDVYYFIFQIDGFELKVISEVRFGGGVFFGFFLCLQVFFRFFVVVWYEFFFWC